jgi:Uma2 family endonuclease
MSPSRDHESIKSLIGRLVETYCLEAGIRFRTLGAWTLRDRALERGAEPDECYVIGDEDADRPHLVIEVEWTPGRIDKLEIYRLLGIREVWIWRQGQIEVHVLRGKQYQRQDRSQVLPRLDLAQLVRYLDEPTAYDAILAFRRALTE